VTGYQVRQNGFDTSIPTPARTGFITAMEADLVDSKGRLIPIKRLMLHHIVFSNLGPALGAKQDATCGTFTALDSVSRIPAMAERFYGAGEERMKLSLPPGYGYRIDAADMWAVTWMVMNHRAVPDRAYIQYRVTIDDDPSIMPVKPIWLDVHNCWSDPVYDVPGGGVRGTLNKRTSDWVSPSDGRLIAGAGHVHGGGKELRISQPDCGDRVVARSRPTWGNPDHPFYNVRPVLHEPGPINMTGFQSPTGIPVAAGQRLRLTSVYDAELPHTRVMGIMVAFLAPGNPAGPCGPLPGDVVQSTSPVAGRTAMPRVTVPLTGLDSRGRARTIDAPPGKLRKVSGSTARVRVDDGRFSAPNLLVRRGAKVSWSFAGDDLHDVTLASGPVGFSSHHQAKGGRFAQRLTVPGTYRIFCSLHPVAMTERIFVR
jgi:plastocyanin